MILICRRLAPAWDFVILFWYIFGFEFEIIDTDTAADRDRYHD
jgi:hypothetical protein